MGQSVAPKYFFALHYTNIVNFFNLFYKNSQSQSLTGKRKWSSLSTISRKPGIQMDNRSVRQVSARYLCPFFPKYEILRHSICCRYIFTKYCPFVWLNECTVLMHVIWTITANKKLHPMSPLLWQHCILYNAIIVAIQHIVQLRKHWSLEIYFYLLTVQKWACFVAIFFHHPLTYDASWMTLLLEFLILKSG